MNAHLQDIMAKATMRVLFVHRLSDLRAINHGWCFHWADLIMEQVPGAKERWSDSMPDSPEDVFDHCFIELNGRFYDSEATNGVTDWKLLPSILGHSYGRTSDCCLINFRHRRYS